MSKLNYNHLYYFYIVAKEGSIKSASEKLHISQPSISDQLKLLEDYFGVRLFDRKNRSLVLNREGQLALEYAEKIFQMGRELTARLTHKHDYHKTSLDIGITHYMTHYFLYEHIMPLFQQNEVAVNIKENDRKYLLADLESRTIDLLFTDNKENLGPNLKAYKVGQNKTYAVAHKKYKKYKKGFPKSLQNIPYLSYTSESLLKYEVSLFFTQHDIKPKVIGEADDIELLQLVIDKGHAFGIVTEAGKKRLIETCPEIIVLGEIKQLQTSVWGVTHKNYSGIGEELLKELSN